MTESSDNFSQIINDLDEDFLNNFLELVHEEIANIEVNLMHIHFAHNFVERLDAVYDAIQKLKVLCHVGFLDPFSGFLMVAERTAVCMRSGKLAITEQLVEVFLLMIDLLRNVSEDLVKIRVVDDQLLKEFGHRMDLINEAGEHELKDLLTKTQYDFSTRVRKDLVFDAFETGEESEDGKTSPTAETIDVVAEIPQEVLQAAVEDEQLSTFWMLADSLEFRFDYWKGRHEKLVKASLLINQHLDVPVDERQLMAAVYMHDLGMGLLPDSLLQKQGKYDTEEVMLMQNHTSYAYSLLKLIPGFELAAKMVYQHHERFDGKGYPDGLKYGEIVEGAQILAITDAFYALTNKRPDRDYRKSIVRTLSELNRNMGTQFDPKVVDAINASAKKLAVLFDDRPAHERETGQQADNTGNSND